MCLYCVVCGWEMMMRTLSKACGTWRFWASRALSHSQTLCMRVLAILTHAHLLPLLHYYYHAIQGEAREKMPAPLQPKAVALLLLISFAHAFLLPPPPTTLSSNPLTKSSGRAPSGMQPVAPLAASVMDQGTSFRNRVQGSGDVHVYGK